MDSDFVWLVCSNAFATAESQGLSSQRLWRTWGILPHSSSCLSVNASQSSEELDKEGIDGFCQGVEQRNQCWLQSAISVCDLFLRCRPIGCCFLGGQEQMTQPHILWLPLGNVR